MLLQSLDDASNYNHIFVAPHLDDAALSCGGQIVQLRAANERVLVVTVCAGKPPSQETLSPFAQYLHREWGLGDDPISQRRDEDARALDILDCDGLQLDYLDAPYRVPAYGVGDGWREKVVADDPLLPATMAILTRLYAQQPQAQLNVPLAVGNHVDHQIVCAAGFALIPRGVHIAWYEDAPYAAKVPQSISQRLSKLSVELQPAVIDITTALRRKLAAIAVYRSQLRELFGDLPMERVMTDYATHVAGRPERFGERIWRTLARGSAEI